MSPRNGWIRWSVVPKPNGTVRISQDPIDLNAAIKREHYKLPTLDEITCQLAGARMWTVLDATSAYRCNVWVVSLSKEWYKLTTFNTPYGRYRYLRISFGACSAQEVFQTKMDGIFEGIFEGIRMMVVDIHCRFNKGKARRKATGNTQQSKREPNEVQP